MAQVLGTKEEKKYDNKLMEENWGKGLFLLLFLNETSLKAK